MFFAAFRSVVGNTGIVNPSLSHSASRSCSWVALVTSFSTNGLAWRSKRFSSACCAAFPPTSEKRRFSGLGEAFSTPVPGSTIMGVGWSSAHRRQAGALSPVVPVWNVHIFSHTS